MGDQNSINMVGTDSVISVVTEKSVPNVVENSESDSGSSIDMKKDLQIPILTDKDVEKDEAKLEEASIITIEKQSVIPVSTEKCKSGAVHRPNSVTSLDVKKELKNPILTEKNVQQDGGTLDEAAIIAMEKASIIPVATEKFDSCVVEKSESESGTSLDMEKVLVTPILTQKIDQQDDLKIDQNSIFPVGTESPISAVTEKSGSNVVEN